MRRLALLAVLLSTLAAGCRSDDVRIVFAPREGARYRYDVRVEAVTVTAIGDAPPRRSIQDFVLRARHRVVSVTRRGAIQLEVRIDLPSSGTRTFTVRFDRAAQLAEVQEIEGLPASALGQLGLSEIFPAAAGAPPDRRLGPGDRWRIDSPVSPLGGPGGRLRGRGRLVELGVVNSRDVATIESTYRLPVERTASSTEGDIVFSGSQSTLATTTHALDDGAVQSARAVTRGRYELTFLPPDGSSGAPVGGNLTVEVRSTTKRVG